MKRHRNRYHSHGIHAMDYYSYQSGLKDWNASYKVLSAFLILVLCIWLNDIWVSLTVIFTAGMINVVGNKIPFYQYLELLKIPIIFLMLGCVVIAFGIARRPAGDYSVSFYWFYLYFTKAEIIKAAEVFFRAIGGISAMYMMALSTPISKFVSVLRKVHVPKMIVELMHMIYRFIFILMDVQGKMKRAAVSRLGYTDFKTSCKSFGKIGGNLFILSFKKADTYYNAMISRCYDGEIMFLEEEKKVTFVQITGMVAYLLALILIWYTGLY